MTKKGLVKLKKKEHKLLQQTISKGEAKARTITRCRILLFLDEGKKDSEIIKALGIAANTIPPNPPEI